MSCSTSPVHVPRPPLPPTAAFVPAYPAAHSVFCMWSRRVFLPRAVQCATLTPGSAPAHPFVRSFVAFFAKHQPVPVVDPQQDTLMWSVGPAFVLEMVEQEGGAGIKCACVPWALAVIGTPAPKFWPPCTRMRGSNVLVFAFEHQPVLLRLMTLCIFIGFRVFLAYFYAEPAACKCIHTGTHMHLRTRSCTCLLGELAWAAW